ncbi:hypothetical protein IJ732_02755 [bacterium]|nr:hypothetical protein [bacterium]
MSIVTQIPKMSSGTICKHTKVNYTPKPVLKVLDNADTFVSSNKRNFKNKAVKSMLVGLAALVASSCATIRGGDFIYDEETERIEDVKDFKKKYNISTDGEEIMTNDYNLYSCHDRRYIEQYGIDKWIDDNADKLTGSCIFDKDDSKISKTIRKYTNTSKCNYEHIPSHAAPIYKDVDGTFKRLQVDDQPCTHSEDLKTYLKTTKRNYIIFMRDFDIDEEKFSKNMVNFIGEPYGYISAIQTVFPLIDIDGGLHCSESYVKGIQDQGVFEKVNANKITPHTLLHLLINKHLNLFKK